MKAILRVFIIVFIIFAGCVAARDLYAQMAGERSLPDDRRAPQPSRRETPTRTAQRSSRYGTDNDQESTMISYVIFAVFGGAILYLAYKGQKK